MIRLQYPKFDRQLANRAGGRYRGLRGLVNRTIFDSRQSSRNTTRLRIRPIAPCTCRSRLQDRQSGAFGEPRAQLRPRESGFVQPVGNVFITTGNRKELFLKPIPSSSDAHQLHIVNSVISSPSIRTWPHLASAVPGMRFIIVDYRCPNPRGQICFAAPDEKLILRG